MKTVLFCISPFHGHINPTLGLIRELVKRRIKVYYFTTEEYRHKIDQFGAISLLYKNFGKLFKWPIDKAGRDLSQSMSLLMHKFSLPLNNDFKTFVKWLTGEVSSLKPDYVVYDYFSGFWAKDVARKLGIPYISSVPTFAVNKKLMEPYPDHCLQYILGLDPKDKFIQKYEGRPYRLVEVLSQKFAPLYDPDFHVLEYGNSPFLNIVYTSRLFQPYSELFDDKYLFIGCDYGSRQCETKIPFQKDKCLIYVSFGTTEVNQNMNLYLKCIEALSKIDAQIIISIGYRVDMNRFPFVPDHIKIYREVPQIELLKEADLFISHAGMNGINEALYYYVPIIAIPQNQDQFFVANRIRETGTGIYLEDKDTDNLEAVVRHILINRNNYTQKAKKIGQSLRNAGGYKKASDEILKL